MAFGIRTSHCSHVPPDISLACGSLRKAESIGEKSYAIMGVCGAVVDSATRVESSHSKSARGKKLHVNHNKET